MRTTLLKAVLALGFVALATGCGGDSASFSVLPTGDTFYQNTSSADTHIDILWVVDNSGSMSSSQATLAQNFPTFIDGFAAKNLDFQMGVTASDSYIALPGMTSIYNSLGSNHYLKKKAQAAWAGLRTGDDWANTLSGISIMTSLTPDIQNVFPINAQVGIHGLGDERPLQSMKTVLDSALNTGFYRSSSFLTVILLTDEDDFSHDGTNYLENQYSNTALHTIDSYKTYLDGLTGSTDARRRYNVHSIAVQDNACRTALGGGAIKIGQRVNQMASVTGGLQVSLCSDFATSLEMIADNILEFSTQFYLSRIPNPSTIVVKVDGVTVPNVANNPGPQTGGWYYNSTSNSIVFQGSYIPQQGAAIQVTFDPVSLGS